MVNPNSKAFTKGQILQAQAATKSNMAAARFLGCSYQHYKKYAKAYGLFKVHKNQAGKGIPKFLSDKQDKFSVKDIVEGRVNPASFDENKLKYRMIEAGYLKPECYVCGFKDKRLIDDKMPLILNFKDKDPRHWHEGNVELLCYNHYFLMIGNIFNKKDLEHMETLQTPNGTSDALNMELDDYTKKRLKELGLIPDSKKKESKYIAKY